MLTKQEIAKQEHLIRIFRQTNALLRGHFELASGLHSGHYFQCALFLQHPRLASQVCRKLALRFRSRRPQTVVGLAVGGIIVAFEVARHLGVRTLYTERVDGRMMLRRGFGIAPKERVLIVEDVITTGESAREVVELVRRQGGRIIGVGAVVDRSGGRAQRLFGRIPCRNLVTLKIENFKPASCPLCKEGWPMTKPGSKGLKLML